MNAILRTSVTASSSVIATSILCSLLSAAPLKYQIDFQVEQTQSGHPFAGATLQLNIKWDAEDVPPELSVSGLTYWAPGNMIASMAISNSTNADGIYDVSTVPWRGWEMENRTTHDSITFPQMFVNTQGGVITFSLLRAEFAASFFNNPYPYLPRAFSSEEATWERQIVQFSRDGEGWALRPQRITGSATPVPEPSTFALGSCALLSLAALRRRK